ncbi:CoA-binding protein [Clostridium ganghwense]|uniref:CoA-binding protein n=1 Tax=Clostridium ganghwense TaxID=312089 RepID=A0ABT4CSU0_9CLOT|nr:CoA-binding protein [Clostridium ganghwense]MCY6372140.1 CoA-binding protein [Clostridium ganghwense]
MNIRDLFNYKNWVVVGKVSDTSKYAYKILKSLEAGDFKTEGVYPKDKTDKIYKSLEEVPYKIDVIDLCINPALGIEVIKEAKKLNIDKVLIQPGAESGEIRDYCKANGIVAIEGCALVQLLIHFNVDINQF